VIRLIVEAPCVTLRIEAVKLRTVETGVNIIAGREEIRIEYWEALE